MTDSDFITPMPSVYREAPWIEIEAKAKEEAIAHLQAEWLMCDVDTDDVKCGNEIEFASAVIN